MMGIRAKWLWMTVASCVLIVMLAAWSWRTANASETKIVYVYSDTCGYCRTFEPTFEAVLADYPQLVVERLDIREQHDLDAAVRLGAEATPTVFVVQGEQAVDKLEGDVPERVLRSFLQKNLEYPLSGSGSRR